MGEQEGCVDERRGLERNLPASSTLFPPQAKIWGPNIYFFLLSWYWKFLNRRGSPLQGPFPISQTWPALPAKLDSAFEDPLSKKIFFFSG